MYRKLLQFLFILFLSVSLYGFSRPASEEDELARLRQLADKSMEWRFDNVPVSDYVLLSFTHDKGITDLFRDPEILSYSDANGHGYNVCITAKTRGGGRTALNIIWIWPYQLNWLPDKTCIFTDY